MKVYREKKKWSDHKPQYHLVDSLTWEKGGYMTLVTGRIKAWCDAVFELRKGDDYEVYNKVFHRGTLCENCIKMIQLHRKQRLAKSSLKTESERNLGEKSPSGA